MGITPQDFQAIQLAPSFEEAKKQLEALKTKVKAAFKKMAFELHPDRTGNDPAKTEKFKLVSKIKDDVEKLNVSPPQRPQPMAVPFVPIQVVFVQTYPGTTTASYAYSHARRQNSWAATTMHPNGVGGRRGR